MNTTSRSIQDHPTNQADREYFAELTTQTQDMLWAQADESLTTTRCTIATAWKSAIQDHKDNLRARFGAK